MASPAGRVASRRLKGLGFESLLVGAANSNQVRAVVDGAVIARRVKIGAREVGAAEVRVAQVGPRQMRVLQLRAAEVGRLGG